ncbi:protocadherin beta-15-like isoform X50 [Alosa alosa]|uniref:protocadherin beta-15-like isoform X50 n=1 Tax=Alosa alosa TaxID=278164 RepID=UPI00201552CC|nr:protocadherin beta-15-like isoform X50 [Alosa alosa]
MCKREREWPPCRWYTHIFILSMMQINATWCQVRYSIPEEMVKGSLVGDVSKDLGVDIKRLRAGRARIVSDDNNDCVELNADKGLLLVKRRIDREELCAQISPCSFSFEIVLENPMELFSITVEITDINDNAPSFSSKEIALDISESALPGAQFVLGSAVDADVGTNTLQTYTLNPSTQFNLKEQLLADGGKYVEMILQSPLDREKQSELLLTLTASDGGTPRRTGTVTVRVNILDANDNAPSFTQAVYKSTVLENSPIGSLVTTVIATDADEGLNGQVSYFFDHLTQQNSIPFSLNRTHGQIKVSDLIDFEKSKQFQINVIAKDVGGLSKSCKVIIEVIDVNDNSPVIGLTSFSNTVPENSPIGTTLAILNVKDLDSGKNGLVNCSINASLPFKVKSSLNSYYTLVTDGLLDREVVSEYIITVTASDQGFPSLKTNKTLRIKISDVNDNAPVFAENMYIAHLSENNEPGVSVASVHARDEDCDLNARISYYLSDSHVKEGAISKFISVNSETGIIHAIKSFDYEQTKVFEFLIKAQDGGSPPLSSNVTVKVLIQDQNDNSPHILYPVQTGGSLVAEIVPRSADIGYLVTKVVAVDVDSGQNAWLSYKLQKPADRPLFEVGAQNGEIRTVRQVTDKDAVKQKLTVVVEDSGQPSRSATVNVNVAVADNFPEMLSEFTDFTRDKDHNDNLTFFLVLALAVASFLFVSCLVVIISVKIYRWRQSHLYQSNLPVIPYYPPHYADAGGTGTLKHVYNYEVCMTTDSRNSDVKYLRPVSQNLLSVDGGGTDTLTSVRRDNAPSEYSTLPEMEVHRL